MLLHHESAADERLKKKGGERGATRTYYPRTPTSIDSRIPSVVLDG